MKYSAFVVSENENSEYEGVVKQLDTSDLPAGEVLVRVEYSSLNFKDALSSVGNKGVTKAYPHTPGIDAAGVIEESTVEGLEAGQSVLVVGYDLGMNTSGAFGEYIRVPSSWVIPRSTMSARTAMAWGTAGFTSALCIEKIITAGVKKEDGPIVVTGGTGGVGSVAIKLLTKLGFEVHAVTSKQKSVQYLESLGASKVIFLEDFLDDSKRPMLKAIYAGGIDVAGGVVLSSMLKSIKYQGAVACCGLVDSVSLNTTVLPFILRGVTLAGVDSVELPLDKKINTWNKMSKESSLDDIEENCSEVNLDGLSDALNLVLNGQAQGRFILKHQTS